MIIFGFTKFRKREFDEMKSYIKHTLTQCERIIHQSRVISDHVMMLDLIPLDIYALLPLMHLEMSIFGYFGPEFLGLTEVKLENVRK